MINNEHKDNAIPQEALELDLTPAKNGKHPELSIQDLRVKVQQVMTMGKDYSHYLGRDFNFKQQYYRLPAACFKPFSKEEKMKLKFASFITMHPTFNDHLDGIRESEVVSKLSNSQWRYGYGQDWNTVVRSYNGLRRFDFGDGFEVRIDMTTGCNVKGMSRYERIFIDGTFGFLIYYKGKHVLTIGFSFASRNRLLIQQVQLKSKKGNRFLYKLPCDVLDYSIEKMRAAFPDMDMYLCQADDQVKNIRAGYIHDHEGAKKFEENDSARLKVFYRKRLPNFNRRASKTLFHGVRFRKLVEKD